MSPVTHRNGVPVGSARPLPVLPPCPHLGAPTGGTVGCRSCSGLVPLPTYRCGLHGLTVIGDRAPASDAVRACRWCNERPRPAAIAPPATATPFEWVSTARLAADAIRLAGKLPPGVSAVAGIPRSGMIPASIIAAHLHLPMYELTEEGRLNRLGHGSRGRAFGFPAGGRVAVVDDTVYGGGAMTRARAALAGRPAVFGAVYARPEAAGAVDCYARVLPAPHLLEWNVMNNGPFVGRAAGSANGVYGGGVGLDLDGVIAHDHASGGVPGTPYLVPRTQPCRLIASGRAESSRAETEAMLRRIGAKWDRLELLPNDVPLTQENAAAHKAAHYRASGLGFFVESDPEQSRLIFEATRKPVICPAAGRVWQ